MFNINSTLLLPQKIKKQNTFLTKEIYKRGNICHISFFPPYQYMLSIPWSVIAEKWRITLGSNHLELLGSTFRVSLIFHQDFLIVNVLPYFDTAYHWSCNIYNTVLKLRKYYIGQLLQMHTEILMQIYTQRTVHKIFSIPSIFLAFL